jgi:ATP-binding cassette subfamily B protein
MGVTVFLIYGLGAYFISQGVAVNYSQLFGYALLTTFILRSTINLVELIRRIPANAITVKRIVEILQHKPAIVDPKNPVMDFTKHGVLEFKHVSFKFKTSKTDILSNISFKINSGERFGIIGSTGSGKSTLISLISRFYDVTSGEILIDGVNIKKLKLHTLHDKVAIVPQKNFLFSDTVKQNVAFGLKSKDQNDMQKIK